jgi:hypothetical protein
MFYLCHNNTNDNTNLINFMRMVLSSEKFIFFSKWKVSDRLCCLVVRYLATAPEVRVRFPALPDFLRSSGSGTGFTHPREYNRGAA